VVEPLVEGSAECIYSAVLLNPEGFALDHLLLWTFVCHDAIWNLVPVLPEADLAKGAPLPLRDYVEGVVVIQHLGLVVAAKHLPSRIGVCGVLSSICSCPPKRLSSPAPARSPTGALEPQLANCQGHRIRGRPEVRRMRSSGIGPGVRTQTLASGRPARSAVGRPKPSYEGPRVKRQVWSR
jgi:hypothetical protein